MATVPNIPKMANAGMVDRSTSNLSIAELEDLLKGKKAKIVELGEKKQTLQDQMVDVDREIGELTGSKPPPQLLSRSEKMKEVWRKRRERQASEAAKADRSNIASTILTKPRTEPIRLLRGSLTHVILEILKESYPSALTLGNIAQKVEKAGWRGKGGPMKQSVYAAIYAFNKRCSGVKYDKLEKTYTLVGRAFPGQIVIFNRK